MREQLQQVMNMLVCRWGDAGSSHGRRKEKLEFFQQARRQTTPFRGRLVVGLSRPSHMRWCFLATCLFCPQFSFTILPNYNHVAKAKSRH